MSRGIPKPFKRDGVDLKPHGRSWHVIAALDLQVGDLVAGYGNVQRFHTLRHMLSDGDDSSVGIYFSGTPGRPTYLDPEEEVKVFR